MASAIDAIVDEFDSIFGLLADLLVEEGDLKLDTPYVSKHLCIAY